MNDATLSGRTSQDLWTSASVPLAGIGTELEKLWHRAAQEARRAARSAAVGADGDSGQTVAQGLSRARVLNFVTYAAMSPESGDELVKTLSTMAAKHSFRTILVLADEQAAAAAIDATITARAHASKDGRKIIHEQVQINARGPVSDSLPSIVLPLLIPDLPTYLWWRGDPPLEHAFWWKMVDACDRLILDSSSFTAPLDSMSRLADLHQTARQYHTCADLAWNQLREWRELVAQFFDIQAYRSCLDRVAAVTIEYGTPQDEQDSKRANPCPALLMAGWLCSRLGWGPRSGENQAGKLRFDLVERQQGRVIELKLMPRPAAGYIQPTVESIRIDATCDGNQAYFEVDKQRDAPVARVTARAPGMAVANRSVSLETNDLAALLATELNQVGKNTSYEAALAEAGGLAALVCGQQTR